MAVGTSPLPFVYPDEASGRQQFTACTNESTSQRTSVMEAKSVAACLLVFVLVCSSTSAAVVIAHNGNFSSGLVLTCFDGPFPLTSGVSFQRNGVDIAVDGGGTLSYPLTQENEGAFTCTHAGQTSDPVTLAGI